MPDPPYRAWKLLAWASGRLAVILSLLFAVPALGRAQSWSWTYELIDLPSRFPSLAVDASSNLHISYADSNGALKYGFRPAGSAHWFNMVLDKQLGTFTTKLTLDSQNNPYICYTPGIIKYARWDGQKWQFQEIAKETGQVGFTCSIVIAKDGTPHLTWYQLTDSSGSYLHIRYAILKDNAWLIRTLDFDRETGKWNSMVLDDREDPVLTYSAWVEGEMRFARWNGKQWDFTTVDSPTRSRGEETLGPGNSLVLDHEGKAHISFYSKKSLRYAHEVGNGWKIETVDPITWLGGWANFRSSLVLDKLGLPHICYEDAGMLKHAYSDGKQWHIQVLARSGLETLRYGTMVIGSDNTIYIAFRDPEDNTLKLATGRPSPQQQALTPKTEDKQPAPQKQ